MNEKSKVSLAPSQIGVEPILPHLPPAAETPEWESEWRDCLAEGAD